MLLKDRHQYRQNRQQRNRADQPIPRRRDAQKAESDPQNVQLEQRDYGGTSQRCRCTQPYRPQLQKARQEEHACTEGDADEKQTPHGNTAPIRCNID